MIAINIKYRCQSNLRPIFAWNTSARAFNSVARIVSGSNSTTRKPPWARRYTGAASAAQTATVIARQIEPAGHRRSPPDGS
jgi:hypothetical protein